MNAKLWLGVKQMKIILSRKGLDSSNSSKPILLNENGVVPFVPIPCKEEEIKYSEIKNVYGTGKSMQEFCRENASSTLYVGKERTDLNESTHCHLDPQLVNYFSENKNNEKFIGSFGQVKQAQAHLAKQGVGKGDLFLFYGWYKVDGKSKNVLFGYLQVGEIINHEKYENCEEFNKKHEKLEKDYSCLKKQPHWNESAFEKEKLNTVYVAKEKISFNEKVKGFGLFKFAPDLVLSNDNQDEEHYKKNTVESA